MSETFETRDGQAITWTPLVADELKPMAVDDLEAVYGEELDPADEFEAPDAD